MATSKNTSDQLAALSALTSSAASVNLRKPGVVTIKPAATETPTTAEPETTLPSPLPLPEPELQQKGKEAPGSLPTVPAPAVQAVTDNASMVQPETDEVTGLVEEGIGEKAAPANRENKNVDYSSFFVKTTSKKEASIRLAASHYDFLQQVSFLLGNNAPLTDLLDNIIADWRTRYEPIMTKEMQKALRKKMSKF